MRDLKDVIEKLGEMSADDIAAHFEEHGIKGSPRSPGQCAVAEYVKQETGAGWVSVGKETHIIPADVDLGHKDAYLSLRSAANPTSVWKFIQLFDEHFFPALEWKF